jgi:hypothetical protein
MRYIVNEAGHMLRRIGGEHVSNATYNYWEYYRIRKCVFFKDFINFASFNTKPKFYRQRFIWENSKPVSLISYWPGEQLIANSILLLNNPHVVFRQRHSTANLDIESGRMSVVVHTELYGEGSSRIDILEIADWCWITNRDPRSLVIFHDPQLATHDLGLCFRCGDSGLRFGEGRSSIAVLLVTAAAHFDKHTEIDASEDQSPQCEQNCRIRSAAVVLPTSPPAARPSDDPAESSSNLTKALTAVLAAALCAILIWFGIPALFTGMDQPSFPLLLLGIATILIEMFIILYTIDMVLGYPLHLF